MGFTGADKDFVLGVMGFPMILHCVKKKDFYLE